MPRTVPYKTFLIAVVQLHKPHRTYEVVKPTLEEALVAVNALFVDEIRAYLVGGLSRNVARRMKLKPDDIQLV